MSALGRYEEAIAEYRQALRFFFFKQKTAYEIGLGIPAEPLFRSSSLMAVNIHITIIELNALHTKRQNLFHKQMDNRIKLLEEILSFRMQGVEFDNGDMYVDGHKAASDVRDEFVSVTEKLRSEERRVGKECRSRLLCDH